jgi:hypothetical protein
MSCVLLPARLDDTYAHGSELFGERYRLTLQCSEARFGSRYLDLLPMRRSFKRWTIASTCESTSRCLPARSPAMVFVPWEITYRCHIEAPPSGAGARTISSIRKACSTDNVSSFIMGERWAPHFAYKRMARDRSPGPFRITSAAGRRRHEVCPAPH